MENQTGYIRTNDAAKANPKFPYSQGGHNMARTRRHGQLLVCWTTERVLDNRACVGQLSVCWTIVRVLDNCACVEGHLVEQRTQRRKV